MKYDHLPLNVGKLQVANPEELDYPPVLYKYRKSSGRGHIEPIANRELFYAAPSTFWDHDDCNIPTNPKLLTLQERYDWYYKSLPNRYPGIGRTERRRLARDLSKRGPLTDPKNIEASLKLAKEDFDNRFGVLCLTADPANHDMWKEYSDDYTGYCLGIEAKSIINLGLTGPVQYVDELPVFKGNEETAAYFVNQVFLKRRKFEFEKEFRLTRFAPAHMSIEDRKLFLSLSSIKEVVIGFRAPDSLVKLIEEKLPGIPIRWAKPQGDFTIIDSKR